VGPSVEARREHEMPDVELEQKRIEVGCAWSTSEGLVKE
jgi:hypothetical protein